MEPWMIWITIGVICIIIEIFTPGFLFMSFGIGAIITGLFTLLIDNLAWQILIFALVTFLFFLLLRKFSKKLISKDYEQTNVQALIGKKGIVIKDIQSSERGYVKIGGEEWSAVSEVENILLKDTKIIVQKIDGNKVVVKKLEV